MLRAPANQCREATRNNFWSDFAISVPISCHEKIPNSVILLETYDCIWFLYFNWIWMEDGYHCLFSAILSLVEILPWSEELSESGAGFCVHLWLGLHIFLGVLIALCWVAACGLWVYISVCIVLFLCGCTVLLAFKFKPHCRGAEGTMCFPFFVSWTPQTRGLWLLSYFPHKETEAQIDGEACPGSHSKWGC